ncbi:hypothetical protein E2C01_047126 [Portunus trituberculatus]|uniref:Uncharacterized protein n=1 Tax=Portunus trituberculatus TaxID=210409 RepID=A0A5B7G6P6_PORTR|nr:hypothetical protein [Portunus trituberculatus]
MLFSDGFDNRVSPADRDSWIFIVGASTGWLPLVILPRHLSLFQFGEREEGAVLPLSAKGTGSEVQQPP